VNLHKICGPGALRVVLAFAGDATRNEGSRYLDRVSGLTATVDSGPGRVTYGQGYMLYLAFAVMAPGIIHEKGIDADGTRLSTKTGLFGWIDKSENILGATPRNAAAIANYEFRLAYNSTLSPFSVKWMWGSYDSYSNRVLMDSNVRRSIDLGVPVWIATLTASLTRNEGLPSWHTPRRHMDDQGFGNATHTHWRNQCIVYANSQHTKCTTWSEYHSLAPGGHAIAIVGYDGSNYYYMDTCARGSWNGTLKQCRFGEDDGDRTPWVDSVGQRAHVWRIPKATLFMLMGEFKWGGAYLAYSGPLGRYPR
jgi:hypothetical protein